MSINTRVVNSTLLYDIMLVVVIGGIGLSGGKGGMRNVVVGALLIGIMLNAMTIIDIPNIYQNLIKVDDPAARHRHRQPRQSARRADRPAGRHLSRPIQDRESET